MGEVRISDEVPPRRVDVYLFSLRDEDIEKIKKLEVVRPSKYKEGELFGRIDDTYFYVDTKKKVLEVLEDWVKVYNFLKYKDIHPRRVVIKPKEKKLDIDHLIEGMGIKEVYVLDNRVSVSFLSDDFVYPPRFELRQVIDKLKENIKEVI
ncbi:MAG: hypothetical protein QW734_07095 [Candidatus Bathyarchaeia archaeon]